MSQTATTGSPKTWFSGDSSPEDKANIRKGALIALFIFAVSLPLALITAVASYLAFARFRIKHTVIAQIAVIVTVLFGITGLLSWSLKNYLPSVSRMIETFGDNPEEYTLGTEIFKFILFSAPLALSAGLIVGALYCVIRWIRRSAWEEFDFRLTPYEQYRRNANIRNIQNNKNSPRDGGTIGVNKLGERIVQTDAEAAPHTLITGGSNTGKTTTKLSTLRDVIQTGSGAVIIDLKADESLAHTMKEYADRFGRNFYHFVFQDPETPYTGPSDSGPAFYDPINRGDASRRKDMIIGGRVWESDYYQRIASNYLQIAFAVMIRSQHKNPNMDSIGDLIELLNPGNLAARARNIERNEYTEKILEELHTLTQERLDKNEESVMKGLRHELSTMRTSSVGHWIRDNKEEPERNIHLTESARKGDIVVFSLDSLGYPELAKIIANFIIGDLKTVASELVSQRAEHPFHVFIDEFAALGSETITNLINKSRAAGMPTTLATQTLGDLKRVDPSFVDQIMGIINAYIIHRPNTFEEAEVLAGLSGKEKKWDLTLGVEHTSGIIGGIGKGAATGDGRVARTEEFTISPTELMKLGRGQCYYIAKSPEFRIEKVDVIPERQDLTSSGMGGYTPVISKQTVMEEESKPYREGFAAPHTDDDEMSEFLAMRESRKMSSRPSSITDLSQRLNKTSNITQPRTAQPLPQTRQQALPNTPQTKKQGGLPQRPPVQGQRTAQIPPTQSVQPSRPQSNGLPPRPITQGAVRRQPSQGLPQRPPTQGDAHKRTPQTSTQQARPAPPMRQAPNIDSASTQEKPQLPAQRVVRRDNSF